MPFVPCRRVDQVAVLRDADCGSPNSSAAAEGCAPERAVPSAWGWSARPDERGEVLPREHKRAWACPALPVEDGDGAVAVLDKCRQADLQRLVDPAVDEDAAGACDRLESAVEGRQQTPALPGWDFAEPARRRHRRLLQSWIEREPRDRMVDPGYVGGRAIHLTDTDEHRVRTPNAITAWVTDAAGRRRLHPAHNPNTHQLGRALATLEDGHLLPVRQVLGHGGQRHRQARRCLRRSCRATRN